MPNMEDFIEPSFGRSKPSPCDTTIYIKIGLDYAYGQMKLQFRWISEEGY